MAKRIRWVGFDMDECLGSFMPLHSFLSSIPYSLVKDNADVDMKDVMMSLLEQTINGEMRKDTWLFRPAMIDALRHVYKAYTLGWIEGAFIFSNNGSEELVNFVGILCNHLIWRLFSNDGQNPFIFKMCIHYSFPFRTGDGVKDFKNIQDCLMAYDLPLMSSTDDLLFFDDLRHTLAGEIRHYIQIRPYFNYTPADNVAMVLGQTMLFTGVKEWIDIVDTAHKYEANDLRSMRKYIPHRPEEADTESDKKVIRSAFRDFFTNHGLKVGGGKKKKNAKSSKTRKISRRI